MKPSNSQDSSKAALMISFHFSTLHVSDVLYLTSISLDSEKTSNMYTNFVVNANVFIFPDVIQLIKCPCCFAYPHTYLFLNLPSDVPNRGSQVPN